VVATSHGKLTSCTRTHVVTLPRRPDKYPCPFYLETGHCAYGGSCKFDHPSRNSQLHRHETPVSAATGGAKEWPKDTTLNRQMSTSGIDVRNESDIVIRHRVLLETGAKEGVAKEKEAAETARGRGAAEGLVSQAAQEKEVADHLLDIVRQATGGRIFAAQLCSALYQKCDIAKVVIQDYKGLKHFVASPVLKEAVEFHADEVLFRKMFLYVLRGGMLPEFCVLIVYVHSGAGWRDGGCHFTWHSYAAAQTRQDSVLFLHENRGMLLRG